MQEIIIKFNEQELRLNIRDEVDQSVMREIFKLREYRIVEDVIVKAVDPIIDVGAHAGFFSIYCRVLNPAAKIIAIEPLQENLEILEEHLKNNKIKGIKIVEGALAKKTDKRKLVVTESSHNNYLGAEGTREVQTYSFHDFCKKNKTEKVSLLKMDIEGGEFEVFDDMNAEDFGKIKAIVLEYHNGERKYQEIENKLRENGFGVQIFPSKFDKTMGFIFANNKRGV